MSIIRVAKAERSRTNNQNDIYAYDIVTYADCNNYINKPVGDMVRSLAAEKVLIFVQKGT